MLCSERLRTKRLVDVSVVVIVVLLVLLLQHSPAKHSEGHPLYIYTQSYVDKFILTDEN